jgi:hypothetical protein
MQPELPAQLPPVAVAKEVKSPWHAKGVLEAEIKKYRDAAKTKAILSDIKGMKGMGHDAEVDRLLEQLGKLGGG